jgi:NTE family protein
MGVRERIANLVPWRRQRRTRGVSLALGGGGARGAAHIGVLHELEEAGIPVLAVAGTSAGAVVGAMWLAGGSAQAVETRWREFLAAGLLPELPDVRLAPSVTSHDNVLLSFARRLRDGAAVVLALDRRSLIASEDLDRAFAFLLPEVDARALPQPFAAVATDLATGEAVALRAGSLRQVVAASSSIPGVIPPRVIDGRALIDGGVVAEVPVAQAAQLGPHPVVAVYVGETPRPEDPATLTVPRALARASLLASRALAARLLDAADAVIAPEVGALHWSDFARFEEAMAAGRAAARAALPHLRVLLES